MILIHPSMNRKTYNLQQSTCDTKFKILFFPFSMAWGQFKHVFLCSCIKLSCMCVLACVSQRWEPQQCQVNTTSARRFTGNYRKQAWCERADWTPRCSSRDPAQARRLGPDGAHTDPHKDSPHLPPAWLHRSLTRSSLAMKPTEAMGAGGRGYGCEPPGTTPPHSTPHKLEGRTERAGGGRCCGWTPGSFFPSLFHLFSLSLCQSRCPFRPSLLALPPFCCRFFSHTRSQTYSWRTSQL